MPYVPDLMPETDPVGDTFAWIQKYLQKRPDWVPTIEQLEKISRRFQVTPKKALELYDRAVLAKKQNMPKVKRKRIDTK